jgi:hypothetical protein
MPDAEDPDRAREALRAILAALDAASPKATRPEGATQERACKPAGFA